MPSRSRATAKKPLGPKASTLIFAALGDEVRLRLVSRLCENGPQSITRLTDGTALTRQAIMKHLRMMEWDAVLGRLKAFVED